MNLRDLADGVLKRQPITLEADRSAAIIVASDAAALEEWRASLVLGHLVVCGNCDAYLFAADPAALGRCRRYQTEAAPFVPFSCGRFAPRAMPTAPAYLPDPAGAMARAREYSK